MPRPGNLVWHVQLYHLQPFLVEWENGPEWNPPDHPIRICQSPSHRIVKGTEYFIEIINHDNILFGLLRLRLDDKATIRELHVYGQALKITKSQTPNPKPRANQHIGLGKQLIEEAEKIIKKKRYKIIRVISGIGVREYYKKLGYNLDKQKIYMEKLL